MPIYEYSCQKCGAHMEVMQKITDKPLARHPKCGGRLTKEWSQTSFQLKGSGWYVTDYAGKRSDAKESGDGKQTKSDSAESKSTVKDTKVKDAKKDAKAQSVSASASGD